jgi:hypothetical protein
VHALVLPPFERPYGRVIPFAPELRSHEKLGSYYGREWADGSGCCACVGSLSCSYGVVQLPFSPHLVT